MNLAEIRKLIIYIAAAAGNALSLGLIPDPYRWYVSVVLTVLAGVGLYAVPNAAPTPAPPVTTPSAPAPVPPAPPPA